ncbi:acetate--CoA ligase family protein [Cryptosporangium aurantiacum]|uniref:Acyl-CoA synthetase (NDP forming) n=1 Tax=Cryptosporangium aurantiacum TaxID=134849 RepID=A0A1M7MBG4_9ACTN|nr:acetate--CoA ligase family protein [Cryptosporangium aurantiacum]SHM87619.1 Acyl-CoA synthetase (NDP forming) [Cryptosporangium aurantiacum]
MTDALWAMLHARSVAVVGASPNADSFGGRMLTELARSPARLRTYLVNPRYDRIGEQRCHPSLDDVPGAVDLVLLGVPDRALESQVDAVVRRGDRGAVIFGSASQPGLRERIVARAADTALCGAGCMGFVNVPYGLRALGYLEPDPLPAGPVALVTHSGSAFSALLRTRRGLGFTLAVSSGQELVTTTADYLGAALEMPGTRVIALLLETLRDAERFRSALAIAAVRDVPVVALTVGTSSAGRAMVAAHSGALAGADGAWEALFDAYGVHRVDDLDELVDTLELFAAGRRAGRGALATVHDSGAERALTVDVAARLGVPFAALTDGTRQRLEPLLDAGLRPENPLDVWGTGADTRGLFGACLRALHDDPGVAAVALAVDLVPEFDGDESYVDAALDTAAATSKPFAVLSSVASAIDPRAAFSLRAAGIPVLEGLPTGLRALGHLLADRDYRARPPITETDVDHERRDRWAARFPLRPADAFALLRDYGISTPDVRAADDLGTVLRAAAEVGWPVVLKTAAPDVVHKTDVGGVRLGLHTAEAVTSAYLDLAARLGPQVLVSGAAPDGVEIALGLVRDPQLGPLVVVGAGGVLVELLHDRAVALPPLDRGRAHALLDRLTIRPLLDGVRGRPAADRDALATAIVRLGQLALELGDHLTALDVNPILAGPHGAVAVDVHLERRQEQ